MKENSIVSDYMSIESTLSGVVHNGGCPLAPTSMLNRRNSAPPGEAAPTSAEAVQPSKRAGAPATDKSVSGRPRKRLWREEKAEDARAAIFAAAAEVVGRHGYADASIERIAEQAGIAKGTFYLYFGSRQELFDALLPHVGQHMLDFIAERIRGSADVMQMEERGFRAFFAFMERNPGFFRILNEAEVAAPQGHKTHFRRSADHYSESLARGIAAGTIRRYTREELETVVYMLMAARSFLYLRFVKAEPGARTLPESVVQTYLKFVRDGLG